MRWTSSTPTLAARQIGFYADVVRRLDAVDRAALTGDDPTLGQDGGAEEDQRYRDTERDGRARLKGAGEPSRARAIFVTRRSAKGRDSDHYPSSRALRG